MPIGVDGLFFQESLSAKPRIFLNSNSHRPRIHFTLAHELGHYFIPWHPKASVICCCEEKNQLSAFGLEKEANNFAGELLMPKQWILELEQNMSVGSMLDLLVSNNISIEAACINITQKATKEFFVKIDRGQGGKIYASRAAKWFSAYDSSESYQILNKEYVGVGSSSILICEIRQEIYTFYSNQGVPARDIFEKEFKNIADKGAAWRSLNGSIAGLNGTRKPSTAESLFQHSMRKVVDRPYAKEISRESLERFVSARCEEFFLKK